MPIVVITKKMLLIALAIIVVIIAAVVIAIAIKDAPDLIPKNFVNRKVSHNMIK